MRIRPALFEAIVQLLQKPLKPSAALTEEDELQAIDNQDEFGYQSNYSRLATVGAKKKDYAAEVVDPNVFLKQSLVALRQSQPRKVNQFLVIIDREHWLTYVLD